MRAWSIRFLALLACLIAAAPALAQDWPDRPIRIIVPFAPGGSADVFGRALAQHLQGVLGHNVVIDSRPGGGTPPTVVGRLNAELSKFTSSADVKRSWGAQGATPITMGVDEFTRYLEGDVAKWAQVVKVSGARPE